MPDHASQPGSGAAWTPGRKWLWWLAGLALLVVLFYLGENLRGRMAWERCKARLEAKGEKLDWKDFIPPPVPDASNVMKVPMMERLFVRHLTGASTTEWLDDFANLDELEAFSKAQSNSALVEVEVELAAAGGSNAAGGGAPAKTWTLAELEAGTLRDALQRMGQLVILDHPAGGSIFARRDGQACQRLRVRLATGDDLARLKQVLTREQGYSVEQGVETNVFRVVQKNAVPAADVIARTSLFDKELTELRAALERPCIYIEGDYSKPFEAPQTDKVRLRQLAQGLGALAKARLLLGQPEQADRDLALVGRISQVSSLDGVVHPAFVKLWANAVEDGFALDAWRAPQWARFQEQSGSFDLLASFRRSLQAGRAEWLYLLENLPVTTSSPLISFIGKRSPWESPEGIFALLAPPGWIRLHQVRVAELLQLPLDTVDWPNARMFPAKVEAAGRTIETAHQRLIPYYDWINPNVVPNYAKAMKAVAKTHVEVKLVSVAAALESYRQSNGEYPDKLEALSPRFLKQLPVDLITGLPFKYRRTSDGKHLLYSVGWDEKDDGGNPDTDWVWRSPKN